MSDRVQIAKSDPGTRFVMELARQSEDWSAGGTLPDILHDLKKEGHICQRLFEAGCRLIRDMQSWHGSSTGLISKYGDQVDCVDNDHTPPRLGADIDAFTRMTAVLTGLRQHERDVLRFCVLSREFQRGGSLSDWGRQHSAYQTAKTARAVTVGQIRSLLESISEMYLLKIPWTH